VKLTIISSLLFFLLVMAAHTKEFAVVTYNVENLFDVDRVAVFEELDETENEHSYSPAHLLGKLQSISKTLKSFNDGLGPEIVAFNELEIDFTPESNVDDLPSFLEKYQNTTVEKMLTTDLNDEVRGLPVEAVLLKHLADDGLGIYDVAIGVDAPAGENPERQKAHKNALFSKFPITSVRSHPTVQARDILEVEVDVDGSPLHVFVNHWKSGASSTESENIRRENARVLRHRLQVLFRLDPSADVIVTGDFNSNYNQSQAFSYLGKTALNDILGSTGDEKSVAQASGYALYNLWYELPRTQRKSDQHQGHWGTLMQTMISPGLYDFRGVQYVDDSFQPVILEGINVRTPLGLPKRWSNAGTGSGVSDHFPVAARFRTVADNNSVKRLILPKPGQPDNQHTPLPVGYETLKPEKLEVFTPALAARPAAHIGEIFRVRGSVVSQKPVTIEVNGYRFQLWSWDVGLRKQLQQLPKDAIVRFIGELSLHRGRWQFVIHDKSWMLDAPAEK
jgi:hypothetical protein